MKMPYVKHIAHENTLIGGSAAPKSAVFLPLISSLIKMQHTYTDPSFHLSFRLQEYLHYSKFRKPKNHSFEN